jgi:hypothetical protein
MRQVRDRERWLPVAGFPDYAVSSWGRVKRVSPGMGARAGRILKPGRDRYGYPQVQLYRNGKSLMRPVHRLVLETFVGPCPEGMEARHLDGDKGNPALSNLAWGTRAENREDQRRHGTMPRGDRHWSRTLPHRVARGDRNGARTKPDRMPRGEHHYSRAKPHLVRRGDRHGMAKITYAKALEIRTHYQAGGISQRQLAEEYDVCVQTICNIVRGESWVRYTRTRTRL